VGSATLWLVDGPVPHYREMVELGREIVRALCDLVGPDTVVKRFADPFWLSSLACVLGFEWNTSGQTTVTLKAIKEGLIGTDIPIRILGGKGGEIRASQLEAGALLSEIGVEDVGEVRRITRLTTSVDESALQDSYTIYFHANIVSESGSWAVINQGMNVEDRKARRYHWSGEAGLKVEEPHTEIVSDRVEGVVLDMTSRESSETRKTIVDMLSDTPPSRINDDLAAAKLLIKKQTTLDRGLVVDVDKIPPHLLPPAKLERETILRAKNVDKFEDLLTINGVGPATIRGLAYIACLIYGSKLSWRDPVKFAYAFGTKSGRPYYVDRKAMLESASFLREAVMKARLGEGEKVACLRRMSAFIEEIEDEANFNH